MTVVSHDSHSLMSVERISTFEAGTRPVNLGAIEHLWQILGASENWYNKETNLNLMLWITFEKNQMQKLDAELDKNLINYK